jgi:diguanylate cyclase (GGDEF)-like protein/PAS domain S-box-containing protein
MSRSTPSPSGAGSALRIVAVYAVFASLWILLSDKAVSWLFADPATMTRVSMVKGWLFVVVTALLLYELIQRMTSGLQDALHAAGLHEQLLQGTLDALPDLLFEVDQEGRIANYHSHRSDLLAAPPEVFLGKRFADLLPPDATEACQRAIDEAARTGFSTGVTYRLQLPQGEHWFELSASHMHSDARPDQRFIMIARDVTGRKRAEEDLRLAAGVFSHAREGITITDARGTIVDVNAAFTRITGYSREEAIGQNPRMLSSGRQDAAFYTAMWSDLLTQGHWSGEVWNRRKDGEVFAEMLTITAVRNSQGATAQYIALFSDITVAKTHQSQLEHIAHFDALTGLPNRLLLADRLHQAMNQVTRRGLTLAVAYLDLDFFKTINDQHGHAVGDELLIAVAHRLKETLRDGDTLARMGGDEFVAVLSDLESAAVSLPMLERMLKVAAEPVAMGDLCLQVSASLGVTFYPQQQDMDADQLLRQADQAMYQAKLSGKNRYHLFDAAQDSSIRGHHESLEHIRQAMENNEFVLHYQPKVNMRTGRLVGAEALIRWQHPQRGLLAPAAFLPATEDDPIAVAIGEWAIDTALQQIERWRDQGLDLPVSVNIGARQLQQVNFVERLQTILAGHPQVEATLLELEILETSALKDMAQVSQVIEACSQLGVFFALDDFGTGYSSLTYLKRLRVTLLKIDQSFVRDMLDDPDDLAILEGIIGLASAFKRDVIAEGVETVAHGTRLLQLGCDLGQGYGIARPMAGAAMPDWVVTWRPAPEWLQEK